MFENKKSSGYFGGGSLMEVKNNSEFNKDKLDSFIVDMKILMFY